MRSTTCLFPTVAVFFALAGCAAPEMQFGPGPGNSAEAKGLIVHVSVPKRDFAVGEQVKVTVTAVNTTRRPISFNATSSARAIVRLFRHTGMGWEQVRRYPQAAAMILSPWRLERGQRRSFVLMVPVEPDWPSEEPLRLTGELNGRGDLAPGVVIRVRSAGKGGR